MSDHTALRETAREYAAAYAAHYSERDLAKTLRLSKKIMASHASAAEAGYSGRRSRTCPDRYPQAGFRIESIHLRTEAYDVGSPLCALGIAEREDRRRVPGVALAFEPNKVVDSQLFQLFRGWMGPSCASPRRAPS
jgi:hypothetical protein